MARGKNVPVEIKQKQVEFYSPDYGKKSKYEREKAVEKERKLIEKTRMQSLQEFMEDRGNL